MSNPPVDPANCECPPWELNDKGFWVRVNNPECPVHGIKDET